MKTANNTGFRKRWKIGISLPMLLLLPNAAVAQTHYTVRDLGTLGGSFSIAFGVNEKSQVTGGANLPGDTAFHAFLWQDGVMRDLGTLGGNNSLAYNPNSRGQVVGLAETSNPDPLGKDFCGFGTHMVCRAFLWQAGVMHDLGTLGGNNSLAIGINAKPQIAGWAETPSVDPNTGSLIRRAFLWEQRRRQGRTGDSEDDKQEKGVMSDLGTLGGNNSNGHTLNERGQVVGWSETTTTPDPSFGFPPYHAFLWEKGVMSDLGTLGGKLSVFPWINNGGQVAGVSTLPGDAHFHGFLWQDGVMTDLGALSGDPDSDAYAINDKGQVVGDSGDATTGVFRASIWENGVMNDLNTLIPADSGVQLFTAFKISPLGEIVAFGVHVSTGEAHGFLLTPTRDSAGTNTELP